MIDVSASAQPGEMTIEQIASAIPASLYSVRKALAALGIRGRTPLDNRRVVLYPPGTAEQVRQWLIENTP